MNASRPPRLKAMAWRKQRGVATLLVALVVLVVLTVIVLFSVNTSLFEQRTALNENRGRLAEQAAEYTLNLAGEYLKGKRSKIISATTGSASTGGWLAGSVATGRHWTPCPATPATGHVCLAEPKPARRAQMYYYSEDGTTATPLPYTDLTPSPAELETKGLGVENVTGTGNFSATTQVRALLCRIDSSLSVPTCALNPVSGNRIAVTLVAEGAVTGENAASVVKETWASYSQAFASSAAPIVASGSFNGNGDATIVASPNAAGYGLPASIWTANDAQVESTTGGGTASLTSCYIGDFMRGSSGQHDLTEAKSVCPQNGSSPPCHCPSSKDDTASWLSGHPSGGARRENSDILDRDNNACVAGNPCPPDIQFFPGAGYSDPTNMSGGMVALDVAGVTNDDSLFEWIFGVDNVVADHDVNGQTLHNCGPSSTQDCADYDLREVLGATVLGSCASLNSASTGLFYVTGNCSISGQVGSAGAPAIIVTFGTGDLGSNAVLYGMLFVHKDNIKAATDASCPSGCSYSMNGGTVFGSVVVEGNIKMAGNPVIIYDDVGSSSDPNTFPTNAKFARVPGSWLDSRQSF
jgi:hypothetical protein